MSPSHSLRAAGVAPRLSASHTSPDALPSLLGIGLTWRVVGWWTISYGLSSWFVEYFFSKLDPSGPIPFWFGSNRAVYSLVWGGCIVLAIFATERWPVTSRRQLGRILIHTALCLAATVLWGVLAYYICLAVVPGWQALGVAKMLASTAKNVLFGYGLVVLLVHIILQVRLHRAREVAALREASLAAQAQLQVLKMELQPHFLFNALHSISALMHTDVDAANDTLVRVADMLRHAVETARVQEVPLREELATLRLYTQIQEIRFGERLRLIWDIDATTVNAAVPHMLLQPIVENAIKHGLEARSGVGRIVVRARREHDTLCLRVIDDGPGRANVSPRRGAGVGIANVRTRLAQLYCDGQSFELAGAPGGGTQVTIRLPFREKIEDGVEVDPASIHLELVPTADSTHAPHVPVREVRGPREATGPR